MDNKLKKLLSHTGDMDLKRRLMTIVKELELCDGDKILDLGCGDGFYLNVLSKLGYKLKLFGCDIDPNALKSAESNLRGKGIQLTQGNAMQKLPYPSNYFDKIIMSEVLEHISDDKIALTEVKRILKPKGTLTLSVPNYNYPFFWDPINWLLQRLFNTHIRSGFWAGIWNQHLRLYALDQLVGLEKDLGFKVEKTKFMTYWCIPFNHYILNFMARLFYNGKLGKDISSDVSKFNAEGKSQTTIVSGAFFILNLMDSLNELLPVQNSSVSIFIKSRK